jgi:hypothetical protein
LLILGHQEHEARLSLGCAQHYKAVIDFRSLSLQISRLSDEVVMATTSGGILLSYPQSEMWLEPDEAAGIVRLFREPESSRAGATRLPSWLLASVSGDRLLLSDQRNARWVLLASEHIEDLERRAKTAVTATAGQPRRSPQITVKGIQVRLQPAFLVAEALDAFARTGQFVEFEEEAPESAVAVARAGERIELRVSDQRAGFDVREAAKWAAVIRAELDTLKAVQLDSGAVPTTVVDTADGRWVLQRGDEVLVPLALVERLRGSRGPKSGVEDQVSFALGTDSLLMMSHPSCSCVAIGGREMDALLR